MSWGEFSGWLVAVALCAAALLALSLAREFLRTVAAMWRPVALVLVSALLLFVNAQGRELGLSLIDENNLMRIVLLFFALVYWATNNWHSARLGLHAAVVRERIPVATGDELSRYWPPRLLGVCAHLFAAINLSLAAARQPKFADGNWDLLLAMTAPIAVICATACVWAVDYRFISERTSRDKNRFAQIVYKWFTRLVLIPTVMISLILAGVLGYGWWGGQVPTGFALGTCSIIASAVVFLGLVSYVQRKKPLGRAASKAERDADRKKDEGVLVTMTCGLFLVAVVLVVCTFRSPMKLGDGLGSMVVAYFALGTLLATVNIVELAITRGAKLMKVSPRRLGGYVGVVVLAFAVLIAVFRSSPLHAVRLCDDKECGATSLPKDRPTVQEAARLWYEKARNAHAKAHPHDDGPIPMLIVATAGGGIRAAYWTASVLEQLDTDFQATGGVSPYLFAISGVSGGSVGATAFEAALAVRQQHHCEAPNHPKAACPRATDYLQHDFLAAGLAGWIFVDPLSNLLPNLGQIDRGTAIEKSFEEASGNELAKPFLNLFSKEATSDWRPILLLNATHEETGQRIITAHVKVERDVFINSLDALHLLGGDVRASTAAHNSARFFYVSPAGALGHDNGSLIDGGYFENYGALSALEISRAAKEALSDKVPKIKRIILQISSDPELDPDRAVVRIRRAPNGSGCVPSIAERERVATDTRRNDDGDAANYLSVAHVTDLVEWLQGTPSRNGYLNELFAPFIGIQTVRESHGTRAAAELAAEICAEWDASSDATTEHRKTATVAGVLDQAKQAAVWADAGPAPVLRDKSYFAHLAMCKSRKTGETPPVLAPLGWVLSDATRDVFNDILHHCDNDEERVNLEAALDKPP